MIEMEASHEKAVEWLMEVEIEVSRKLHWDRNGRKEPVLGQMQFVRSAVVVKLTPGSW